MTIEVISSVDAGTEDAETTEVTTFVDEGSTVVVLSSATDEDTAAAAEVENDS